MKVTLVTASFNDLVHGTFNDKKTGCGINLMKPDTASRYQKGREMSYLGEITCEKCKAKIAKEMIKADSKEMKALLKEEKMRAKRGGDDGLVQLSELGSRPVSAAPSEPAEPKPTVTPAENVQINSNNPAYSDNLEQFAIEKPEPPVQETHETIETNDNDDFLAQFAINKPQETPAPAEEEEDFLAQFAIKKPQETPAPAKEEEEDFLAQFAIKKPQENHAPAKDEEDFLAQFSVSAPQKETTYEEPSAPPVIDDIADALSAMQNSPVMRKEPEPEQDDILSMFAIDKSETIEENTSNDYINPLMDDDDDESIFDAMNTDDDTSSVNEWDIIANQLFGDISDEVPTKPPVIDDITVPEIEEISTPVLDDIKVPEIDDISAPALDDIKVPEIEEISAPAIEDVKVPEIEEISAPALDDIKVPEIEEIPAPAIEDIKVPEIEIPTIDDKAILEAAAPVAKETPAPEQVKPAPKPVSPAPAPVQQAPKTVTPVQPVIPPVQPMPQTAAPQSMPQNIAPQPMPQVAPMGVPMGMGMGQIVTVPQQTGFDKNGQPVYAYMQMIFQGYDQNGQPIMMPMPQNMMGMGMGMPMQMPVQPVQQPQQTEYSSLNKNSRLQSILDSLDEPVSEKEMTIGQKIAAAEAAKGSPISANVSKIATNPHSRSTSQAFINAISDSKDDTQSLTETQGLKPKTVVLDSIEDVLSQLGDNSLKEKKEKEAKLQSNVPVYQEFKTPSRPSSSFSRPVPSSSGTSGSAMSDIPLTKAQQKELKRQQKIDNKFRKEMAKRNK